MSSALYQVSYAATNTLSRIVLMMVSLSQRLETEVNSLAFTATETLKIHQTPIPVSRLPDVSTPMDELWTVKTALDLVNDSYQPL